MTKYKARRSFYGDLGSIRRNQVIAVEDGRIAEQLVKRGLLAKEGDGDSAEPKAKSTKPKAADQ